VVLPELARLPGAGRVEAAGLTPLRAVVRPHAAALAARDLTVSDLLWRLDDLGYPASAGRVRDGGLVRPLQVRESVRSLDQLRALLLQGPTGGFIPLGDVAEVTLEEVSEGASFRWNGEEGVLLQVYRAPGANAVALAAAVGERVRGLGRGGLQGMRLSIVSDRSRQVVGALVQLGLAALAGVFLGTLVLRLLLGRWRPTVALGVVVPASILGAFAAFHLWGIPLNVISLAGLALAAGMLVDNSVVVLESIETARGAGAENPALAGTRQVAAAVVASCLTTVVVFLPLVYLRGLARAFFGEQAFAVVSSLLVALLLSLTLTPVLSARGRSVGEGRQPGRNGYLRLLGWALARPILVIVAGLLLSAVTVAGLLLLPRDLFPQVETRWVQVAYRLPPDLSEEEAERRARTLEADLLRGLSVGSAVEVSSVRGLPEIHGAAMPGARRPTRGMLELGFRDGEAALRALDHLRRAAASVPEVKIRIRPRPSVFMEAVGETGAPLEIVVSASTEGRAAALASSVADLVAEETGVRPVPEEEQRPRPALFVEWDEVRLANLELDQDALEGQVRGALGPTDSGFVDMEGADPRLRVEGLGPLGLEAIPLGPASVAASGEEASPRMIPLGALGRIEGGLRPARVRREEGRPAERLVIEETGRGMARLDARRLEAVLAGAAAGPDEQVRLGGQARELERSFAQLRLAFALAVILAFLTLAAIYESVLLPPLVMTTLPVAAGGALGLLLLTGQSMNLMAFLGLIFLGGIVVNNAIVLVHRIEDLRREGMVEGEALLRAASDRYRPILMTTATTLLGMLPLALLAGEGVELRRAISLTVLGGLLTSTFASLLLVPVLHQLLERIRPGRGSREGEAGGL
jgi:HAE1 family hydrophobic/amphiphilic exporter-1